MRWIIVIALGVFLLGWIVTQLDVSLTVADDQMTATVWRRTVHGWEKISALSGMKLPVSAAVQVWNTHPHPLLISVSVALLSLLALFAFAPGRPPEPKRSAKAVSQPLRQVDLRSSGWFDDPNLR